MKLSAHLQSVLEDQRSNPFVDNSANSANVQFLEDIIPQIIALENRNERLEHKTRQLRVKFNAAIKTIQVVRTLVSADMVDPHKPFED